MREAAALARHWRCGRWWIKDEGRNPTGSFKARGMTVAVSMARDLGARSLFAPSAGNAGVALAAYGRQAGLPVTLAFPQGTPAAILDRSREFGATVQLVPGSIADAGKKLREQFAGAAGRGEAFDLSTFREPFRVEGKKTMGFEIYEQLGNRLPDAIVYPLGGGTGLVALEKAFDEMEALGWSISKLPRLYAVQAEGCAPIVQAFAQGESVAKPVTSPSTAAHGLRVPATLADSLCLRALRRSGGAAISVTEEEIESGVEDLREHADLHAAPEAGAALAGARKLLAQGRIAATDEIVVFVTAAATVYE